MAQQQPASSSSEQVASVTTIRRITRELAEIQAKPSAHWKIQVIGDNILEYHFTIRGPPASDFEGGLYHGRLLLPINYPFAPPSIMLLSPSGRFEIDKKICLSMSNYHPELWQPAWGIRTIMEALRSFFPTPGDGAIGALDWPADVRKKIANESRTWTCEVCQESNEVILPTAPEEEERAEFVPAPVLADSPSESPRSRPAAVSVPPVAPPQVAPPNQPRRETAGILILNVAIFSVLFLIIALIVDIVRDPTGTAEL
jgi:ubiquitin-protein ligase